MSVMNYAHCNESQRAFIRALDSQGGNLHQPVQLQTENKVYTIYTKVNEHKGTGVLAKLRNFFLRKPEIEICIKCQKLDKAQKAQVGEDKHPYAYPFQEAGFSKRSLKNSLKEKTFQRYLKEAYEPKDCSKDAHVEPFAHLDFANKYERVRNHVKNKDPESKSADAPLARYAGFDAWDAPAVQWDKETKEVQVEQREGIKRHQKPRYVSFDDSPKTIRRAESRTYG